MKVLVANLGSTSFKYKVFDMPGGEVLLYLLCDGCRMEGFDRRPIPDARSGRARQECRSLTGPAAPKREIS